MLCDICQKKKARIYYTEIINGEKKEQHLCEDCAAAHSSFFNNHPLNTEGFNLGDLLSGFLQSYQEGLEEKEEEGSTLSCVSCGLSYEEFLKEGKFGCADCYQSFFNVLPKNFRNIQGAVQHTGKQPKKHNITGLIPNEEGMKKLEGLTEIDRLSMQLQQAVETEEFEEAARLRDLIRSMKVKA